MATPHTLTTDQAAPYIGMSPTWLRQQRSKGAPDQPPFVRIGRSIRYLRDDLDRWLADRRYEPSTSDSEAA